MKRQILAVATAVVLLTGSAAAAQSTDTQSRENRLSVRDRVVKVIERAKALIGIRVAEEYPTGPRP